MRGDLYKGKGALDLPLSSRGQTRTNSGLPAERTTGHGRRQTLLLQSNETQRYASGDHSRRVCSFPSGHPGTEIRGQHTAPWTDPIQQILEQCRGAGSSARKTADCADAGVQAIRYGDNHDQRDRIGGKDQESSIQDRNAGEEIGATTPAIWAAVLAS